MNDLIKKYILRYKNEILNNQWDRVFPISILEDYLEWDDVNSIYESLINADIYIDLETLFKQDYKFHNYILRNKNESIDNFEDRALTQFHKEATIELSPIFNEFTFNKISNCVRDVGWLNIEDIDMSGDINTKPTEATIEVVTSRYAYPLYVLRFINQDKGEELIVNISSETLERNLIYFPYGIGYNLWNLKAHINLIIQDIEKEIIS